jgi:hypothetical protein
MSSSGRLSAEMMMMRLRRENRTDKSQSQYQNSLRMTSDYIQNLTLESLCLLKTRIKIPLVVLKI